MHICSKQGEIVKVFARRYENKSVTFWERVIFKDETQVNLFGREGFQHVWRKMNETFKKFLQSSVDEFHYIWSCVINNDAVNIYGQSPEKHHHQKQLRMGRMASLKHS